MTALSRQAMYSVSKNKKDKILTLENPGEENEEGHTIKVLLGFYYDKKCSELNRTVLLYIEVLGG